MVAMRPDGGRNEGGASVFFDEVDALPSGQVEVSVDDLDDGVIDIGWDLLSDVTPHKWQKVPPDFDAVKRDWTRWYLDDRETTLDRSTLLAMYVLVDNNLPYETDVDYVEKLSALVRWLAVSLAAAGFDVDANPSKVTDVRVNLRNYLAELPGPARHTLEESEGLSEDAGNGDAETAEDSEA